MQVTESLHHRILRVSLHAMKCIHCSMRIVGFKILKTGMLSLVWVVQYVDQGVATFPSFTERLLPMVTSVSMIIRADSFVFTNSYPKTLVKVSCFGNDGKPLQIRKNTIFR